MIRPPELQGEQPYGPTSSRAGDVWEVLEAAARGEVDRLRRLLERDPSLHRAEYWYTPPLHLAVCEGRLEAARVLLEAGADPTATALDGEDLLTVARDRGHDAVARLLEEASARRPHTPPADPAAAHHPVHAAAAADDVEALRRLLDGDPALVHLGDRKGATPLHRAVAASARGAVALLLERGADVHALHGQGPGDADGYAPADFEPIDLALWHRPHARRQPDAATVRLLLGRGDTKDLVIAAALGDIGTVRALLDADPRRIRDARPSGKRALSAAVEAEHLPIVRLLLERGADPNWPEGGGAPRGTALHAAARAGNRAMVELLLDQGADPNATIDSSGSATWAARDPELRAVLLARGGRLDAYDLIFLDDDEEALRLVRADPSAADAGCGGALAAACKLGKRALLVRLLEAGARVPPMLTACRSYLLGDPDLLRLLLRSGMDPDLPNWQRARPLHDLCGRDARGRPQPHRQECAAILLDAGATLSARDDGYRSTPLAWAARGGLPDMVELLLARGAPVRLPDDEPWATPLAWATRRGHAPVADILRRAGATA